MSLVFFTSHIWILSDSQLCISDLVCIIIDFRRICSFKRNLKITKIVNTQTVTFPSNQLFSSHLLWIINRFLCLNCLGDKSKNIYFPDFVGCTNYNMDHGHEVDVQELTNLLFYFWQ